LKGIKGGLIPLRTLAPLYLLHFNPLHLQALPRQFGSSSTESLRFLGDLLPLPFMIFKP
jgi:hypothetical protein